MLYGMCDVWAGGCGSRALSTEIPVLSDVLCGPPHAATGCDRISWWRGEKKTRPGIDLLSYGWVKLKVLYRSFLYSLGLFLFDASGRKPWASPPAPSAFISSVSLFLSILWYFLYHSLHLSAHLCPPSSNSTLIYGSSFPYRCSQIYGHLSWKKDEYDLMLWTKLPEKWYIKDAVPC